MDCLSFSGPADVVIVHLNPDEWPALLGDEHWEIIARARKVVGAWVWEGEKAPDKWYPAIDAVDAIWAPSRYAADVFERSTRRVPVDVVPYCIPLRPEIMNDIRFRSLRGQFGIAPEQRIILSCLDGQDALTRQNPLALIGAYEISGLFKEGWVLVLRTEGLLDPPEALERLKEVILRTPGALLIHSPSDHADMDALLNRADIYASAHRIEIDGLIIAEAMARGKSVVATDYGGNRDFLDPACGYPVPYTLRTHEGRLLAEVDGAALANLLLTAAERIAAGDLSVGRAARERVSRHFSPPEVVQSMWHAAVAALGIS